MVMKNGFNRLINSTQKKNPNAFHEGLPKADNLKKKTPKSQKIQMILMKAFHRPKISTKKKAQDPKSESAHLLQLKENNMLRTHPTASDGGIKQGEKFNKPKTQIPNLNQKPNPSVAIKRK